MIELFLVQGKNDEAYKLYLTLERHPQADVQKRAKRMLFGFRFSLRPFISF